MECIFPTWQVFDCVPCRCIAGPNSTTTRFIVSNESFTTCVRRVSRDRRRSTCNLVLGSLDCFVSKDTIGGTVIKPYRSYVSRPQPGPSSIRLRRIETKWTTQPSKRLWDAIDTSPSTCDHQDVGYSPWHSWRSNACWDLRIEAPTTTSIAPGWPSHTPHRGKPGIKTIAHNGPWIIHLSLRGGKGSEPYLQHGSNPIS